MNNLYSTTPVNEAFPLSFRMKGDDLERRSDMINRELRVLMSVEGKCEALIVALSLDIRYTRLGAI